MDALLYFKHQKREVAVATSSWLPSLQHSFSVPTGGANVNREKASCRSVVLTGALQCVVSLSASQEQFVYDTGGKRWLYAYQSIHLFLNI